MVVKLLGYSDADDGKFWISYEDFSRVFITLYTCKVLRDCCCVSVTGEWSPALSGGAKNRGQNPQFVLRSKEAASVTLVFSLLERDSGEDDDRTFTAVYVLDVRGKRANDIYSNELVAKTSYGDLRDTSLDFNVSDQ